MSTPNANPLSEPSATSHARAVDRIVEAFESLTPESVADLGAIYTEHAHFKDPFNDIHGLAAIQGVFQHMYEALVAPRFVVTRRVVDGAHCFLVWEFHFRFRRFRSDVDQCIFGTSHLQLAPDGRILDHRDYWDAAEELYEKLPLIGGLMRWLRQRAAH
jgi:limonene-1,2-epoxide hydrolase